MREVIYSLTCLGFTIVIGGAVYEHIAVVPYWSAAPPASLAMFQGDYGLNPGPFWMITHPLNVVLYIITLILFWRTRSRKNILIPFVGYIIILIITSIYFVPELMAIVNTPYAKIADESLTSRAKIWEILSITRLIFLIILAIILFLGLTKTAGLVHKERIR